MTSPSYYQAGTPSNVAASTFTPALPATWKSGCYLIAYVTSNAPFSAPPAGWSIMMANAYNAGNVEYASMYYKAWLNGDTAPTFTSTGSTNIFGMIFSIQNCGGIGAVGYMTIGAFAAAAVASMGVATTAASSTAFLASMCVFGYPGSTPASWSNSFQANDGTLYYSLENMAEAAAGSSTGSTSVTNPSGYWYYTIQFEALAVGASPVGYINNGGMTVTGSSPVTPPLPPSANVGDLLVLQVMSLGGSSLSTPSGWTQVTNQFNSGYSIYYGVFYQAYAGGAAPSVVCAGSVDMAAVVSRFVGCSSATPVGAAGTVANNTAVPITSTGLTTTGANSVAILSVEIVSTGATLAAPTNWSVASDLASSINYEMALCTQIMGAGGSTTGSTSSADMDYYTGYPWYAIQFEMLAPVSAQDILAFLGDNCALFINDNVSLNIA